MCLVCPPLLRCRTLTELEPCFFTHVSRCRAARPPSRLFSSPFPLPPLSRWALSPQHPDFFAAHLAEAVVALNGCDDHPVYLAAASRCALSEGAYVLVSRPYLILIYRHPVYLAATSRY